MSADTSQFLEKIIPPIITLLITAGFSVVVGVYLEKFKNKLIFLKYNITISPLATSIQDTYWGNIEVKHNGRNTKNLTFVTIDIINDTNNDVLKDINLDIWVSPNSQILAVNGNYNEIGNAILLEDNYFTRYARAGQLLAEENIKISTDPAHVISSELQREIDFVQTNKKFHLPIFNRNSSAKINLLVESWDGKGPTVSVSILQTSIKLIKQGDSNVEKKKQDLQTSIYQLIIYAIGLYIIFNYYSESKAAIIYTMVAGVLAFIFARLTYSLLKFIKRMFW